MYSLMLFAFVAARVFTESLLSNDGIPLLLQRRPICHNMDTRPLWLVPKYGLALKLHYRIFSLSYEFHRMKIVILQPALYIKS
jgi:hypothetical protein